MADAITIGDITIQRVLEQQAPFFDMTTFFPTLSKELLDENRHWLEPKYVVYQVQSRNFW